MQKKLRLAWRGVTGLILGGLLVLTAGCAKDDKQQGIQQSTARPSVVDTLVQAQKERGQAVFTALGSSVTSGVGIKQKEEQWTAMLVKDLMMNNGLDKLDFHNNGYPGITTTKILSEKRVEEVIAQKPDLILFETCLLNDYNYLVPLDQTITSIDTIMNKFQAALPHTLVILQSPNPRDPSGPNKLGLTYQNYLDKTKEHILAKGWPYIDVYSDFEAQRKQKGYSLAEVLPDGIHPNELGSKFWYNTLKNYFYQHPKQEK